MISQADNEIFFIGITLMNRCIPCYGSGKLLGPGMISHDCEHCKGKGKIEIIENEIDFLELKNTESYKKAREQIKEASPLLTDDEADKMLDIAFEETKLKRGRPKFNKQT